MFSSQTNDKQSTEAGQITLLINPLVFVKTDR